MRCHIRSLLEKILIPRFKGRFVSNSASDAAQVPYPINKFTERTHNCGQLSKNHVGERVQLLGWVQYSRFDNKIIALRDSYGTTQCIVDKKCLSPEFRKTTIHNESVLKVSGIVKERLAGHGNASSSTGEVEVLIDRVDILNSARKDMPILTREHETLEYPTIENRLKYRYLDIKSNQMQHALRFRSQVCRILRNKLYELNFVECETPTLYNRTPGGANEFVVPTKERNKYYSLVQSPQQLKQLLMIGGLDRYFQICRCYRDESGRSDRQPEFTQLDIELSFTNQNHVMNLVDELVHHLLVSILHGDSLASALKASFDRNNHIQRISLHEAFMRYGTDKPDLRFDWSIKDHEDDNLYIEIPYVIDRDELFSMLETAKQTINSTTGSPVIVFECHDGESTRIKTSQRSDDARRLLGVIRNEIARQLSDQGKDVHKCEYKFVWVTDFPLFTYDDRGKLEPNHHPFTTPTEDTIHLLDKNPLLVRGQHYDLVLNGQEVAGGSMRIHDAELQRKIFVEVLQVDESTFEYFIEALSSGCPPHGGIAFGLDRLIAILLNKKSIRDVIAFPKTSSGRDLMVNCPEEIGADVKNLYHLV